jgi:predicted transcriptional regulator of viral defense system
VPAIATQPTRLRDLEAQGLSRMKVKRMLQRGELIALGRGLYAAHGFDPSPHHALAVVAARVPHAVVCLTSALAFHGLTTSQPADVWIAVQPGSWRPKLDWPVLRVVQFGGSRFHDGIEQHVIDGTEVKIYGVAKTVVDCFRFRSKVGLDVALEAMRETLRNRRASRAELAELGHRQRAGALFRSYLEAVT